MNRVRSVLEGKVIFITGATGFLGQPLVEKLLRVAPGVKRIYLLIRPKRRLGGQVMTPGERLGKELFQSNVFDRLYRSYGTRTEAFLSEKVVAVSGDISGEHLGMDPVIESRLYQEVDIVINSAAVVSFDAPLNEALEVNGFSAARIAAFTRACKKAVLIHVSTAYVGGTTSQSTPEVIHHTAQGEEVNETYPPRKFSDLDREILHLQEKITELRKAAVDPKTREMLLGQAQKSRRGRRKGPGRENIESLQKNWLQRRLTEEGMKWARQRGWNDTYTYTKAIGEQMVVQNRNGVPTVIIRPSVIESSLSEPSPGWLDGLRMADPLIVAIGKGRLRSLPLDANVVIDLIPVDMVVNALLASIPVVIKEGGLKVYHIATGAKNPITLGELHELVYEYFQKNPMLDKQGRPINVKPLRFPKPRTFRIQYKLRRGPLAGAERALGKLPPMNATEKLKRKISAAKAAYDRLYYYGEIYQPYLNLECRFEVDNTQQLFNSLNEEEKKLLNFDIATLNWRHYIQNVHIPGIKKHILKLEGVGSLEVEEPDSSSGLTINSLVRGAAERFPNKTALQIKRDGIWKRFTYKKLQETAQAIGESFRRMGLRKGDRVVLYSENKPEWGLAYLGATSIGLVVVPLDAQAWHKEVWSVAQLTEAQALLTSQYCFSKLRAEGLEKNEHSVAPVKLLNVDQQCAPFVLKGYPRSSEPPSQQDVEKKRIEVNPDDPASIIFTNSTAVDPKGVIHTHRNFINNLLGVNHYLPARQTDQLLSVLPLYHALEFTCGFLMAIYGGATVTYVNSLKPKVILESMKETGTTCMLGVPTLYALIRDDIERRLLKTPKSALKSNLVATSKQLSLSVERAFGKNIGRQLFARVHREFGGQIRLFVSGGSALGEELYEDFRLLGMPIYEGYGLTETAPVLTVNPLNRSRKGSAGKPLPGVELRIFSPDKDGAGEIIVRSPSLMKEYYKNPAATERVIKDGWFHTGDLGWVDADGYLYITGRKKDVIVTGAGKNVYPVDLEAIYQSIPAIEEVCVLGVKSGLTEDVHAVLVPSSEALGKGGSNQAKNWLQREIQGLAKELPSYHRLQYIHVWEEPLPRTHSGEICRPEVRRKLMEQLRGESARAKETMAAADRVTERSQEEKLLCELSRLSGTPAQEISENSHLYLDLGLDSLMAIQFLLYVEQQYGISVPDRVASSLETVGQVLAQVRSLSRDKERIEETKPELAPLRSARPYSERSGMDRCLLRISFAALEVLYRKYFHLQLHHREHLPEGGPYIIAANHSSHLDAGAVLSSLSTVFGVRQTVKVHVLGARDYFFNTTLKRWFFSTFLNLVPVEREETSLAGLRMVKAILSAGEAVLIFPEGTRSRTGQIQKFRPGVGLIAAESGVPVVPAYIEGTRRALPAGRLFPRRKPVEVFFGPSITMEVAPSSPRQTSSDDLYRKIATEVYQAVLSLANKPKGPL